MGLSEFINRDSEGRRLPRTKTQPHPKTVRCGGCGFKIRGLEENHRKGKHHQDGASGRTPSWKKPILRRR